MKIDSVDRARQVLGQIPGVVGVGVTAWARSGVASLIPNYSAVAFKEAKENSQLRKEFPIRIGRGEKMNTSSILANKVVQEYFKMLPKPTYVFVYKTTKKVDELTEKLGLKLISNRSEMRDPYEDKRQFRVIGKQAGLPLVPGESLRISEIRERKLGVVLQLTDYSRGGGVGTFFIKTGEDWHRFDEFVRRRGKKRRLEWVNVTQFIEGRQASITGCVTRHGILTGVLQGQIMDQPELMALVGRSGVWLGHDWSGQRFSGKAQQNAEGLVRTLGKHMHQRGYKGIFGMDVVVDKDDKVWPIECNARYTGAFPTYTWASLKNGEIPLDVWHLLEFMDADYEMDIDKVQQMNRQPKAGAQILMHNLESNSSVRVTGNVRPGIYRDNSRVRDGWNLLHIKEPGEFVVTDGVPFQDSTLKPAERLGRLLFNREIVDRDGRLLAEIQGILKKLYRQFKLKRISRAERIREVRG